MSNETSSSWDALAVQLGQTPPARAETPTASAAGDSTTVAHRKARVPLKLMSNLTAGTIIVSGAAGYAVQGNEFFDNVTAKGKSILTVFSSDSDSVEALKGLADTSPNNNSAHTTAQLNCNTPIVALKAGATAEILQNIPWITDPVEQKAAAKGDKGPFKSTINTFDSNAPESLKDPSTQALAFPIAPTAEELAQGKTATQAGTEQRVRRAWGMFDSTAFAVCPLAADPKTYLKTDKDGKTVTLDGSRLTFRLMGESETKNPNDKTTFAYDNNTLSLSSTESTPIAPADIAALNKLIMPNAAKPIALNKTIINSFTRQALTELATPSRTLQMNEAAANGLQKYLRQLLGKEVNVVVNGTIGSAVAAFDAGHEADDFVSQDALRFINPKMVVASIQAVDQEG